MTTSSKFLMLSLLVFSLFLISLLSGLRFNFSHSFPPGIYFMTSEAWPKKGDLISFCPPRTRAFALAKERGYLPGGVCPGDYRPLMKKIAAVSGDILSINSDGVFVNGVFQKNSRPFEQDLQGQKMPNASLNHYTIPKGKVLLLSDYNALSFDGRYFGLVDESSIRGILRPIITF